MDVLICIIQIPTDYESLFMFPGFDGRMDGWTELNRLKCVTMVFIHPQYGYGHNVYVVPFLFAEHSGVTG